MDSIFRDHILEIISLAISVITLIVTIYFFFLQRFKRSLVWVLTETNLLKVSEDIKDKVKVLYDDTQLENLYFIKLQIINNGNVPIKESDFDHKLSFDFVPNVR